MAVAILEEGEVVVGGKVMGYVTYGGRGARHLYELYNPKDRERARRHVAEEFREMQAKVGPKGGGKGG